MSSVSVAYALYLGSKVAGQKVIVSLPSDSTLGALSEAVWKKRAAVLGHCEDSCQEKIIFLSTTTYMAIPFM